MTPGAGAHGVLSRCCLLRVLRALCPHAAAMLPAPQPAGRSVVGSRAHGVWVHRGVERAQLAGLHLGAGQRRRPRRAGRAAAAARLAVARGAVAVGGLGLCPPELELLVVHGEVAVEGLGGLLRTGAHEEGDEGAAPLGHHLDLLGVGVGAGLRLGLGLGLGLGFGLGLGHHLDLLR